ncbi:hypothetical protein BWI15_10415 [Kribbella sp. ALI-6-A]|nr:hypothetical protein BWI15_10415 [Kribbella sp. ALI-6-A]
MPSEARGYLTEVTDPAVEPNPINPLGEPDEPDLEPDPVHPLGEPDPAEPAGPEPVERPAQ